MLAGLCMPGGFCFCYYVCGYAGRYIIMLEGVCNWWYVFGYDDRHVYMLERLWICLKVCVHAVSFVNARRCV